MFKNTKIILLRFILCVATATVIASAVSCTRYTASDFYGGESVDSQMLGELDDKLAETTAEKYPAVTNAEGEQIFFWTPSGSVYHKSENCPRLSSSSEIRSGTLAEATDAKLERGCSVCCKGQ